MGCPSRITRYSTWSASQSTQPRTGFIFASRLAVTITSMSLMRRDFWNRWARSTSPRCAMINGLRLRAISPIFAAVCAAMCGLLLVGCSLKQDMALQPKNRPLSPSDFFADGRSERPILENTVARGSLADDALYVEKDSNTFPLPVTQEL